MYARKPPKSERPDKARVTIHSPHSKESSCRNWRSFPFLRVVSMDPGIINFAIRVERRPWNLEAESIVTELFKKITFEVQEKDNKEGDGKDGEQDDGLVDGAEDGLVDETGLYTASCVYTEMNNFLNKHLTLFKGAHLIIIERQIPDNYKMVRASQHVITYFLIHLKDLPHLPLILEIDPKLKSKELHAPKGLNPKQIKQWSIFKAREYLKHRGDTMSLKIIEDAQKRKRDDLSDTVIQIEAICHYLNLPVTNLPVNKSNETLEGYLFQVPQVPC